MKISIEKTLKLSKLQYGFMKKVHALSDDDEELLNMLDMAASCLCHFVTKTMSDEEKAQYFVNFAYKEKKVCESLENKNDIIC